MSRTAFLLKPGCIRKAVNSFIILCAYTLNFVGAHACSPSKITFVKVQPRVCIQIFLATFFRIAVSRFHVVIRHWELKRKLDLKGYIFFATPCMWSRPRCHFKSWTIKRCTLLRKFQNSAWGRSNDVDIKLLIKYTADHVWSWGFETRCINLPLFNINLKNVTTISFVTHAYFWLIIKQSITLQSPFSCALTIDSSKTHHQLKLSNSDSIYQQWSSWRLAGIWSSVCSA